MSELLTPRDLESIADLELVARLVVEGYCAGLHRSPHKGFSIEFKQHRQYVPGDDIRRLDWKVFGKSDRLFVREYEAETNLRATLLLDVSGSMAYSGAGRMTKHEYATRLAACLAYLLLKQGDSVGLATFDTEMRRYIPARSNPKHVKVVIDELASRSPGGETDVASVLHRIAPRIHRRGVLVVFSDCFGDVPALLNALAHLRHASHEVIVFQIWDRDELEFPFTRWTRFECLEREGSAHTVDPAHLREAYLHRLEEFRRALTQGCRRYRIDLEPLVTDVPYADALARYVALRRGLA